MSTKRGEGRDVSRGHNQFVVQDKIARYLEVASVMSMYQRAIHDLFGIGPGSRIELMNFAQKSNSDVKSTHYQLLRAQPARAFIATDQDDLLAPDGREYVFEVDRRDLTRERVMGNFLILLAWIIASFSLAFWGFQARPMWSD